MAQQIYFGNLRRAGWVKAFAPGADTGAVGQSEQFDYANGGSFVSQSGSSHREFNFSWPTGQESDFRFLNEYRNCDYGTGLLYWVDPYAMDINALPPHWARPELTGKGWPSLLGAGRNPSLVDAGATATNLFLDPRGTAYGATSGALQWRSTRWFGSPGAGTYTSSAPVTDGPSGITTCVRKTWTTAATGGGDTGFEMNAGGVAGYACVPGDVFTASCYMRASVVRGTTAMTATFYNAAGTMIGSELAGPNAPIAIGAWSRRYVTATAPALAAFVRFCADVDGAEAWPISSTLDATGAMVEKSSTLNPYFDGSSVFIDGSVGAWTGTVAASTSTMLRSYAGLPLKSAQYTIDTPADTVSDRRAVLLIPDTKTLWLGFSGSQVGTAVVRVRPIFRDGSLATPVDLTLLSDAAGIRLNASFSGATYSAVQIYMTQTVAGTSTIKLTTAKAIYANIGATPDLSGTHVSGLGHSGLRFKGSPTLAYTYYNEDEGKKYVSAAAQFTEVGSWL